MNNLNLLGNNTLSRYLKIAFCATLLCVGLQAADLQENYSYCDSSGNCTISGTPTSDGSNLTGSDSSIFGVYKENEDYDYHTITIQEGFTLNANTKSEQEILGIWKTLDTVTNNGTLTNTNGYVIRVGSDGSVNAIYNNKTMTSEYDYALRISNGGYVGAFYNGSESITSATMSGIYILGTLDSLYNYGSIIGNIEVDSGSIGAFDNNGTVTGDINVSSGGEIGTITNAESDTINGNVNVSGENSTIGEIDNAGTVTGGINVSDSGSIGTITNAESGTINGGINVESGGTISEFENIGTIKGDINVSEGSTITRITNSGEMNDIKNSGTIRYITSSGGEIGDITNSGTISTITAENDAQIGDIYNDGTISTLYYGRYSSDSNSVVGNITNSGTLKGIRGYGTVGDITNSGEITNIYNYEGGSISNIYNSNYIQFIYSYAGSSIGTIDNSEDGDISSIYIYADSTIDKITNAGTITSLTSRTTITNGVSNKGSISTFNNSGTTTLTNYENATIATVANNSTITDLYNAGEIQTINNMGASSYNNPYIGTLTNAGAITILYNYYDGTIENLIVTETGSIGGKYTMYGRSYYGTFTNYGVIGTITVESGGNIIATLDNSGEITNITNKGEMSDITNSSSGTIGEIENSGTMGYIDSSGAISKITNSGTMGAIKYTNSDTQLILEIDDGLILLNENVKADDKYVQIYSNNINIVSYTLYIAESANSFNSFRQNNGGYTNEDDDTSSHLTIGVSGSSGNINIGTIVIDLDYDKISYNTNYSLSSLVALYNVDTGVAIDYTDYSNYGLDLDASMEYGKIYTNNELEYTLIASDSGYFQIYNRDIKDSQGIVDDNFNKHSPAHPFYKNNILTMNTLLAQSEAMIYSPLQRYGFRNTQNANKSARFEFNNDYVISHNKPYSDFVQTAAYNEDSSNEDSQYNIALSRNVIESSDDYFFFSPFVSNHSLYGSNEVRGSGMSYGFISGYNKEIDNSLIGFHFGFDYGNFNGDNATFFDIDSISALLGLHYRYDFSNDIYIKARGDVYYSYYSINAMYAESIYNIDNFDTSKQHPETIGFNVGIVAGKQWDIADNDSTFFGIVNLEGGINYVGLYNTKFAFNGNYDDNIQYTESHRDSFFNLLYCNLDTTYEMIEDHWSLNMGLGVKALVTPLPKAKITARSTAEGANPFDVASKVYTDRVFGTALFGVGYKVNENISLMANYLGIYGDKSMSNSGFFNIRVWW